MAAIGIGHPFQPDLDLRSIIVDAVAVGNATARTVFFQTDVPDNLLYYTATLDTPAVTMRMIGVTTRTCTGPQGEVCALGRLAVVMTKFDGVFAHGAVATVRHPDRGTG